MVHVKALVAVGDKAATGAAARWAGRLLAADAAWPRGVKALAQTQLEVVECHAPPLELWTVVSGLFKWVGGLPLVVGLPLPLALKRALLQPLLLVLRVGLLGWGGGGAVTAGREGAVTAGGREGAGLVGTCEGALAEAGV